MQTIVEKTLLKIAFTLQKKIAEKCGNASMDIVFFIDGSNSLKRESFNLSKQVVTNFIKTKGVENTRYAVVSFVIKRIL